MSTSCSLLHVPYTLKHETKLSQEFTSYFAFAEEKLAELKELGQLADQDNYQESEVYQKNKALFAGERDCHNEEVTKRLSGVIEKDYIRLPKRSERQALQKKELKLPEFPTTTIGSFPQTKDVKANRSAFRRGEISKEEYVAFNKRRLQIVSNGRKRSDWTYWYTENMSEMTWWNISVRRWEAFCLRKKRGYSPTVQDA